MFVSASVGAIIVALMIDPEVTSKFSCALRERRTFLLDRGALLASENFIWSSERSTDRQPSPRGGARPPILGKRGLVN